MHRDPGRLEGRRGSPARSRGNAMMETAHRSKLYEQVAERLGDAISAGTLRPGERLPSVRDLSTRERVSISTVLQAYLHLESLGLVETRPQSGHYVRRR